MHCCQGKLQFIILGFCLPGDDTELPSSLSNDSDEIESFEELFQRLAQMKGQNSKFKQRSIGKGHNHVCMYIQSIA